MLPGLCGRQSHEFVGIISEISLHVQPGALFNNLTCRGRGGRSIRANVYSLDIAGRFLGFFRFGGFCGGRLNRWRGGWRLLGQAYDRLLRHGLHAHLGPFIHGGGGGRRSGDGFLRRLGRARVILFIRRHRCGGGGGRLGTHGTLVLLFLFQRHGGLHRNSALRGGRRGFRQIALGEDLLPCHGEFLAACRFAGAGQRREHKNRANTQQQGSGQGVAQPDPGPDGQRGDVWGAFGLFRLGEQRGALFPGEAGHFFGFGGEFGGEQGDGFADALHLKPRGLVALQKRLHFGAGAVVQLAQRVGGENGIVRCDVHDTTSPAGPFPAAICLRTVLRPVWIR